MVRRRSAVEFEFDGSEPTLRTRRRGARIAAASAAGALRVRLSRVRAGVAAPADLVDRAGCGARKRGGSAGAAAARRNAGRAGAAGPVGQRNGALPRPRLLPRLPAARRAAAEDLSLPAHLAR